MKNQPIKITSPIGAVAAPLPRRLFLTGGVESEASQKLREEVLKIGDADKLAVATYAAHGMMYEPEPIELHIDSYGGSIVAGFGLYTALRTCGTRIRTVVAGSAYSMGFVLTLAGDERWAYENAHFLVHAGKRYPGWSCLQEMADHAEDFQDLQKRSDAIIVSRTKITRKMLDQVYKCRKDWRFFSEKALELGVIQKVIK